VLGQAFPGGPASQNWVWKWQLQFPDAQVHTFSAQAVRYAQVMSAAQGPDEGSSSGQSWFSPPPSPGHAYPVHCQSPPSHWQTLHASAAGQIVVELQPGSGVQPTGALSGAASTGPVPASPLPAS
jgi:hypothetical protein